MPLGQGISYCRQAREIIMNVWGFFKRQDAENDATGRNRTAVNNTLLATGVKSRTTLYKLNRTGPVSPEKRGPTIAKIHDTVKQEINFKGSKSTLLTLLKEMGYKYGKRPTRDQLKERPDIVAKRHDYLSKIHKLRLTNCPFVYLDETFLHQNHTVSKCWLLYGSGGFKVPTGKGSRFIILHAGSKQGFIPNCLLTFQSKTGSEDYHQEMTGDVFTNWFTSSLIPNIPAHSCIVMDNASYHTIQESKVPTMSSTKAAMQNWLTANRISWSGDMIKAQLNLLIQQNKPRLTKHVVDELARSHGHYVLRLPPYHCELNPIELIWAQIGR